jgi:hypothetical protein
MITAGRVWLDCMDPRKMLQWVRGGSERGRRLFACACCRMIPELSADEQACAALTEAEACAAGPLDRRGLETSWRQSLAGIGSAEAARALACVLSTWDASWSAWEPAWRVAVIAQKRLALEAVPVETRLGRRAERRARGRARQALRQQQCNLLRCIFANPYRPTDVTSTLSARDKGIVPHMARMVYAEGLFGDLPILADALEEAGCTDTEVLEHCRGPGPHARGCWVLDLLLSGEKGRQSRLLAQRFPPSDLELLLSGEKGGQFHRPRRQNPDSATS